jgi:hypothetical protein
VRLPHGTERVAHLVASAADTGQGPNAVKHVPFERDEERPMATARLSRTRRSFVKIRPAGCVRATHRLLRVDANSHRIEDRMPHGRVPVR